MSKYFTKYLPVSGEIKEGEIAWHPEDGYFQAHYIDKGIPEGSKKVKLFLCSRDIQVGDKIKDENDLSQEFELNNKDYLRLYKKKSCTHHFKVIGEISPNALSYVKEGQEFEFLKDCWISNSEIGQLDTYKIKGPCGHFH